jgi:DNA-binding transcriptional ArsR family regulator
MSSLEEETYSTMFTSLRHPARRKILRMLSEKPRNFSEILEELGISSSHLTYHLENLGELVSKMEDGRYRLSTFGEAAVATMSRVEEAPKTTEAKHPLSLPVKWRSFFAVLMIGLVILSGVCYTQYRSLNQISAEYQQISEEYEQLKGSLNRVSVEYEQVSAEYEQLKAEFKQASAEHERIKGLVALTRFEDVSLQSKYILRFFLRREADATKIDIRGPWDCVTYIPYDNSTLYLILSIVTPMEDSYVAVSIQEGNAYDPTTNETAPVIWSLNATKSSILYVPLPSKGWYTISLVGLIRKRLDESGRVIGYTVGPMPGAFGDVDCSLSFRIIYEGNYIPFIVTRGYRYPTWIDYISPS